MMSAAKKAAQEAGSLRDYKYTQEISQMVIQELDPLNDTNASHRCLSLERYKTPIPKQ